MSERLCTVKLETIFSLNFWYWLTSTLHEVATAAGDVIFGLVWLRVWLRIKPRDHLAQSLLHGKDAVHLHRATELCTGSSLGHVGVSKRFLQDQNELRLFFCQTGCKGYVSLQEPLLPYPSCRHTPHMYHDILFPNLAALLSLVSSLPTGHDDYCDLQAEGP